MRRKVVLTGTTGHLGSLVLKHLVTRLPISSIIVSLYNASGVPDYNGLDVRRGDFREAASLDRAFAGGDVLFMMSYPSIRHRVRVEAHTNAIEAAKRSGTIKHIIYTSLAFAGGPESTESVAAVMRAHLDTEAYLKRELREDMTYTIIREGLYTESFPLYFGGYEIGKKAREVCIPGGDKEGLIGFTKREELGEATAKIICTAVKDGGELNRTVLLARELERILGGGDIYKRTMD